MTRVTYDFDNAISEVKKLIAPLVGGDDYNTNENLQFQLEAIMICYHQCQNVFHGVANGEIHKKYQELLEIIDGGAEPGFMENTKTLINLTNEVYKTIIRQAMISDQDKYSSYKQQIVNELSDLKSVHDEYAICETFNDFTIDAEIDDVDINVSNSGYDGKSNVGVIFEQMAHNLDNYEDVLTTVKENYTGSVYQYIDNPDNIEKITVCLNGLISNYENFYTRYTEILTYLRDIMTSLVAGDVSFKQSLEELTNNIQLKDVGEFGINKQDTPKTMTNCARPDSNSAGTAAIAAGVGGAAGAVVATASNSALSNKDNTILATGANSGSSNSLYNPDSSMLATGSNSAAGSGEVRASQTESGGGNGSSNRTVVANPNATEQGTVYKDVNGQKFDLYIPENVEADAPLIVYLPGIGAYGSEANLQADGGGAFTKGVNEKNPNAYVLSIQYPSGNGADFDVDKILGAVYDTIDTYGIDRNRVSICGYSKGSYVMPKVINKDPNLFSSAAFIASNAGNTEDLTNLVNIPVKGYYGKQDRWAAPTAGLVDRINAAGGNAELIAYDNQGHAYMPGRAIESGMIDWMLEQTRA